MMQHVKRQRISTIIWKAIAARTFAGSIATTVSIGIAGLGKDMDADRLLKAADEALYRAKRAGRNRCEVSAPAP